MLRLGEIRNAKGAHTEVKRLGRGAGSGRGQTAGKGNKGQLQRTGGVSRIGFEGGQMPLYRRVPKKGFTNIFRLRTAVVNLEDLAEWGLSEISLESLQESKKVRNRAVRLKVLGRGDLKKALKIKAHSVSESAKAKIEKAGGSIEILK